VTKGLFDSQNSTKKRISVKSEFIFVFFCWYHLPAKCVMVFGTRQQAPVSGA